MASPALLLRDVEFTYPSAPHPIIRNVSATVTPGFTGVIGPNGAGKTTLLKLATGVLKPDNGRVAVPPDALYCAQRTDDPPEEFDAFFDDGDAQLYALRGRLGIARDWQHRWHTLSHGERKRAQVGVALWRRPALLAIDEPTNHLDREARGQLIAALASFSGIGLLVSHDRDLLDALCAQCLWIEGSEASLYPGGYTAALATREAERLSRERVRAKAIRERDAVRRERGVRREHAARAARGRSKRGIDARDSSARAAVNLAKNTDSGDGQRLRQLDGRMARADDAVTAARVEKRYTVGIELPGVVSHRQWLLQMPEGELSLGGGRSLRYPALALRAEDRVALTGDNGVGKSTLLEQLRRSLRVDDERVVVMPQEVSAERAAATLAEVKALPRDKLGHAMSVVSCLGSRPGLLLDSVLPSPGELRKLLLALGMTRSPHILLMDEPTNHLDAPSLEAMETALAGCSCAMLLVSHDARFLDALTTIEWRIERSDNGSQLVIA